MASNSELEQADSTATIRLLTTKYWHTKGSTPAVVGETPSRLHWLLQGGQCVHKDHEGIGWEWATRGPIPTGGRVGSRSSSSSNSSASGGKRKEPDPLTSKALSLGSRLLGIAEDYPTEFLDVVKTHNPFTGSSAARAGMISLIASQSRGRGQEKQTAKEGPESATSIPKRMPCAHHQEHFTCVHCKEPSFEAATKEFEAHANLVRYLKREYAL